MVHPAVLIEPVEPEGRVPTRRRLGLADSDYHIADGPCGITTVVGGLESRGKA